MFRRGGSFHIRGGGGRDGEQRSPENLVNMNQPSLLG